MPSSHLIRFCATALPALARANTLYLTKRRACLIHRFLYAGCAAAHDAVTLPARHTKTRGDACDAYLPRRAVESISLHAPYSYLNKRRYLAGRLGMLAVYPSHFDSQTRWLSTLRMLRGVWFDLFGQRTPSAPISLTHAALAYPLLRERSARHAANTIAQETHGPAVLPLLPCCLYVVPQQKCTAQRTALPARVPASPFLGL